MKTTRRPSGVNDTEVVRFQYTAMQFVGLILLLKALRFQNGDFPFVSHVLFGMLFMMGYEEDKADKKAIEEGKIQIGIVFKVFGEKKKAERR